MQFAESFLRAGGNDKVCKICFFDGQRSRRHCSAEKNISHTLSPEFCKQDSANCTLAAELRYFRCILYVTYGKITDMKQIVIKVITAIVAFVLVFAALQRLLIPKYASFAHEGNLIREYYSSTRDHDVIILGDCEVYANISPIALWENYGISSFIRGSPQQLVWHSYYLLEDTLRHARELPQLVIFNVMTMQYAEPQYEPFNRLTLDGMRLSPTKIRAVRSSMMEDEDMLSYIFPFFRFKDNWRYVGAEDFRFFFRNPQVSINGFMIRSDVMPVTFIPDPLRRATYEFGEKPLYYLQRMVDLTRQHGIDLMLIKAPVLFPHWADGWNEQIVEFAHENNLIYINFLEYIDEIGLDFSLHTFNAGLHLNVFGAELMASHLGQIITENFDIPDRRSFPETAAHWAKLTEQYRRLIEIQQQELAETGRVQSILIP